MHIWTRPFLLLFLGAAVLGSLLVIFPLPAVFSWIALGAELALCLVGWWMVRARLLRAGLLLQALLVVAGFLSFLLSIRLQPGVGFVSIVVAEYVLGIASLLSVAVFLCLSYGIARWRAPLDAWLTITQVAVTVGVYGFLMIRNFDLTDFFTRNLTVNLAVFISLASPFFIVLLLLLRGTAWKRVPVAIALLLAGQVITAVAFALPLLAYAFVSNPPLFSTLANATRFVAYLQRAAFPLLFLGLLVLIQSERRRGNPQPAAVPDSPARV